METSTSTGDQTKPFACPACPSHFTRQENLNRHISSVHRKSNLRPFACPQCAVSFSRSDLRKRHVRKFHPQQVTVSESSTSINERHKVDETSQLSSAVPLLNSPVPPVSSPLLARTQNPAEHDKYNTAKDSNNDIHNNKNKNPESTSSTNLFTAQNISWLFKGPQFIATYFENFHPLFPIIHQPTFDISCATEPLLQAIACNGAIYQSVGEKHDISLGLFEAGLTSLDTYVQEAPCAAFKRLWVLQAYILFEHYAIYSCQDGLFTKAVSIHRRVVDAARLYQLLQDGVTLNASETGSLQSAGNEHTLDDMWQKFTESESRKRIMYCLFYLDSQMAICCNVRPLLTSIELKYELPCRDDLWSASTATEWELLVQAQEVSFNEEDDNNANLEPRPAQGDLYENLMQLMNPNPPKRPLGFLWRSPFSCLMLIIQIQMMVRDLTVSSIFLFNNISSDENRHNLSIISEDNRAPIMRALEALADLMPKITTPGWPYMFNNDISAPPINPPVWHSVWIAWHYTAMCLTHQDALLTSGIVEYSLPTAISTTWELGKPRARQHRDIYEDRDVIRLVNHFETILLLLTRSPVNEYFDQSPKSPNTQQCTEDPFTTLLCFKACIMGWRVLRLMALTLERSAAYEALQLNNPSIYSWSARVVLSRIFSPINPDIQHALLRSQPHGELPRLEAASCEDQYLKWMEQTFTLRGLRPITRWILAVISETRQEEPRNQPLAPFP